MGRRPKTVSIADVASECGVSPITVSRAFRQGESVASDMRSRILAVAKQIGYRPRPRIGRPRREKSVSNPTINIVIGTSVAPASAFNTELLVAIEQELGARGYDCVIRVTNDQYEQFISVHERLAQALATSSGTLIIGHLPLPQLEAIFELCPEAILVDHTGDPSLGVPYQSIGFDNVEAARLVVGHLLQTGRRRIVLIEGEADHYFSRDMERGYRDALDRAGLSVDTDLICQSDFTMRGAAKALNNLIDRGIEMDAVFTNDEMAPGVLATLHERGLAFPAKVAVAGCDGLPIGEYTIPKLTTVNLDYRQLGRVVVEHVLGDEAARVPCRIRLLPNLEVRESTPSADA